jgi:hypothetical protein
VLLSRCVGPLTTPTLRALVVTGKRRCAGRALRHVARGVPSAGYDSSAYVAMVRGIRTLDAQ